MNGLANRHLNHIFAEKIRNMYISETMERELRAAADPEQRAVLMRFFKTAPGEYGEGDEFLGVRVPTTRAVVRDLWRDATDGDVRRLTASAFHEVRMAGFLTLINLYVRARKNKDESEQHRLTDMYLSLLDRGNNWDLVDIVAPKILGDFLLRHPSEREVLYELAAMEGQLWHQRVAMVSCWTMIRAGDFDDALRLALLLMHHPHDLMHKACGWQLREVGKRGGLDRLMDFLDAHAAEMPRTMLRYAIERLPERARRHYMAAR